MSRATKRKHVLREILNDLSLPTSNQMIVKALKNRGNNLHEVITKDNKQFLVSLPTKFRRTFWVRRGNYLLIEPIEEGKKVKGEIVKILTKDLIKYYQEENQWPIEFSNNTDNDNNNSNSNSNSGEDSDLEPNPNRPHVELYNENSDSDSDTDSDSDSDTDSDSDSDTDSDSDCKDLSSGDDLVIEQLKKL